jgi:excinuclease UvrABC helicase subunit UvrB
MDSFLASILSSRFKKRLDPSIQITIKERTDNTMFKTILDWYHMVNTPPEEVKDITTFNVQSDTWAYEVTEDILDQEPNKIITKKHLILMLNERMGRAIKNEDYKYAALLRDRIKYINTKYSEAH